MVVKAHALAGGYRGRPPGALDNPPAPVRSVSPAPARGGPRAAGTPVTPEKVPSLIYTTDIKIRETETGRIGNFLLFIIAKFQKIIIVFIRYCVIKNLITPGHYLVVFFSDFF